MKSRGRHGRVELEWALLRPIPSIEVFIFLSVKPLNRETIEMRSRYLETRPDSPRVPGKSPKLWQVFKCIDCRPGAWASTIVSKGHSLSSSEDKLTRLIICIFEVLLTTPDDETAAEENFRPLALARRDRNRYGLGVAVDGVEIEHMALLRRHSSSHDYLIHWHKRTMSRQVFGCRHSNVNV